MNRLWQHQALDAKLLITERGSKKQTIEDLIMTMFGTQLASNSVHTWTLFSLFDFNAARTFQPDPFFCRLFKQSCQHMVSFRFSTNSDSNLSMHFGGFSYCLWLW